MMVLGAAGVIFRPSSDLLSVDLCFWGALLWLIRPRQDGGGRRRDWRAHRRGPGLRFCR